MPLRHAGQYFDSESDLFYNHYRYYDPKTGRYLRSDPIGLEGGLNTFGYVYGSPLHYVDSDGTIPVFLVTGAIGGVIGGGVNIFTQYVNNGGFQCFDWGDFGIATGIGAAAGATAPFLGTSLGGAIAIGATANTAQYVLTNTSNNQPVTTTGVGSNAFFGGLGGGLGGAFTRTGLRFGYSIWLNPKDVSKLNNSLDMVENVTMNNLAWQITGGAAASFAPSMVSDSSESPCSDKCNFN